MTAPVNTQATEQVAPAGVVQPVGPHPGDEPLGNPASRWIAGLTSLLLLALAGVAARDLWYHFYENEEPSQSWIGQALNFLGSFAVGTAAVAAAIVLSIIGLAFVVYAFAPRPHTHVRVNSPVSIWTRPVDIARKATGTTRRDVAGDNVRSKADRKKIKVELTDDGSGAALQERVTRSLNNEFKSLAYPPAVTVKLRPNQTAAAAQQATAAGQPAAVDQAQGAAPQHTGNSSEVTEYPVTDTTANAAANPEPNPTPGTTEVAR